MKNIIINIIICFVTFLSFAQNKYTSKIDQRLFDERNFSFTSTENDLSKHFKSFLSEDILKEFQWGEHQKYVIVSFELNKENELKRFKISPSSPKNKKINKKIILAFSKYDSRKLLFKNHELINQYSFIVLQKIDDKTVVKCSDDLVQKSPLILSGCQKYNSYKEICKCNNDVVSKSISDNLDVDKLSLDYLENPSPYQITRLYSSVNTSKYYIGANKNRDKYIDKVINTSLIKKTQIFKNAKINGLDYFFKQNFVYEPSKSLYQSKLDPYIKGMLNNEFPFGLVLNVEKLSQLKYTENKRMTQFLKSNINKDIFVSPVNEKILKKPFVEEDLICWFKIKDKKIIRVLTNCHKFNRSLSKTILRMNLSFFNLKTEKDHFIYKVNLGTKVLFNSKVKKIYLKPKKEVEYLYIPGLELKNRFIYRRENSYPKESDFLIGY